MAAQRRMPVAIKAALITGGCAVVAAVVLAVNTHFVRSSAQNQQTVNVGNSNTDTRIAQNSGVVTASSNSVAANIQQASNVTLNNNSGNTTIVTPMVVSSQPDYIEGTQFTRRRLAEFFPFGYAVFFYGQNRVLRDEIISNGIMDWTMDTKKVTIEPDFYSGKVKWFIPDLGGSTSGNAIPHIEVVGATAGSTAPFKIGCAASGPFIFGNKPIPYFMTLNDNERTPVFAIGFRIPTAQEIDKVLVVRP